MNYMHIFIRLILLINILHKDRCLTAESFEIMGSLEKKEKQAVLSRATLEISSSISSEYLKSPSFKVVFHWRSSSIGGCLLLEVIFHWRSSSFEAFSILVWSPQLKFKI